MQTIEEKDEQNIATIPVVSVVMPAYNVEKYIGEAIESIINQSLKNWELIVVDDRSKDKTVPIVESYIQNDTRIRLIMRKQNSGGARLPRLDGVMASISPLVCTIDSDDVVESEYLQKMIARQRTTQSDIVLSRMLFCNEELKVDGRMIPCKEYDMNSIFSGEEAVKCTLGGWEIALGGMLVKSNIYKNFISSVYNTGFNIGFADDLDYRKLLLAVNTVSMVNATYLYRQQPNSVIHQVSLKRFEELTAARLSYEFIKKKMGEDKIVMQKIYNEYLNKIYRCQILYWRNRHQFNYKSQDHIKQLIFNSYSLIKKERFKFQTFKNKLLSCSFSVFRSFSFLVYIITK